MHLRRSGRVGRLGIEPRTRGSTQEEPSAVAGLGRPECSHSFIERHGNFAGMTTGEGAVLVTGATGSVGRFVVSSLTEQGVPVRRAVTKIEPGASGDQVRFDFADPRTWEGALDGVDRVFLMRPPAISDVKGVIGPFITALARQPIKATVVLSLMGVNRAMPHWQLEHDVKAAGVPWVMLRPAFFMQNLQTAYLSDIRDHDRIRLPAGRGKTSFIDTRDIADVATLAMTEPKRHTGNAYTLTGGQALGWSTVASMLSAELGRPIDYQPVGLLTARREMTAQQLPKAYVNVQLLINVVARLGLAAKITDELPQLLGRPPRLLSQYLTDNRECWTGNLASQDEH